MPPLLNEQRQEEATHGRGTLLDNRCMNRCSSSPVISTLQNKITMGYHLGSWIMPNGGQDVWLLEFLEICRLVQPFWRAVLGQIQYSSYTLWPSSATAGMNPRQILLHVLRGHARRCSLPFCLWQKASISGGVDGYKWRKRSLKGSARVERTGLNIHMATWIEFKKCSVCQDSGRQWRLWDTCVHLILHAYETPHVRQGMC